jgi:hypothetical protein
MDAVSALFKTATTAADAAERQTAAVAIASAFAANGVSGSFAASNIVADLIAAMASKAKTGGPTREGACQIVSALVSGLKASSEPFLTLLVEPLLNLLGDKIKSVAVAAQAALDAIMTVLNPNAVKLVLPALLTSNDKWQANEARLNYIIALSKTAKVPLSKQLGTTIPVIVHDIHDLKEQVSAAAKQALLALCACCSNTNIEPFISGLMTAMEFPEQSS